LKHRFVHFEQIDSTNSEARRLAERGERGPLWILANEQTSGRGRLGREWISEPGNLYATFLFPISGNPEVASQVSFVAALAIHDLVTVLLPHVKPLIKWPNDVLIDGAKFCGVLAEVVASNPTTIALGCGINLVHAPPDMPYPVTALARYGDIPEAESILRMLAARLSGQLAVWNEGEGFAEIRRRWTDRAAGLNGKAVAVVGEQKVRGTFRGLATDGALLLELPDGTQRHIHAGDVRFAAIEASGNLERQK
jgi:BirA family transcriptional regulator, biotin operon repressor / biotin---[acetyl-CoA-carboxylase] ligase